MNETREPRPVSYGDAERARRYVKAVTESGPQSGPVYLIVSPSFRADKRLWPKVLTRLRETLPGITFRVWQQIAEGAKATDSPIEYIRDNHAGAILIGSRHHHMIKTGPVALAEATAFAAAGKPMMVFTGSRLIAWPDCQVLKIPPESRRDNLVTAYVLMPLRPESGPLPTLQAAMRALGCGDPGLISRAAGLSPQRPARGPQRPPAAPSGLAGSWPGCSPGTL